MSKAIDEKFMTVALDLASAGSRAVSPNPMVGAVLVRGGRIVARGYHRYFGGAHAEVECLSRYRGDLTGTTMYVTLEPCSHYGKTPPCAQMLASTPIRRIVVAMADPNPLVAGQGIKLLRKAGKRVEVGVLADEAADLNRRFPDLDVVLIESGGDNLAATFSPDLADITIYVISVAQGEKIPRKGGPAITKSDLLVITHTDLAPYVNASLEVMEADTQRVREGRPYVFSDMLRRENLDEIIAFIERAGGLQQAVAAE